MGQVLAQTVTKKVTQEVEVVDVVKLCSENSGSDRMSIRAERLTQDAPTLVVNGWDNGVFEKGVHVVKEDLKNWCEKVLEILNEAGGEK
jgi:hypothetical protein